MLGVYMSLWCLVSFQCQVNYLYNPDLSFFISKMEIMFFILEFVKLEKKKKHSTESGI